MDVLKFVDIVYPHHCRGSCSDSERINGFFEYDYGMFHGFSYKCERCAALDIIEGKTYAGFVVNEEMIDSFKEKEERH